MHELFLTAAVKDSEFETACAVLQGVTWMVARKTIHRELFFSGPPQPKGLPKLPYPPRGPPDRVRALWNELGKHLARSSYVLCLAYEVFADVDFGSGAAADLNALAGTLRWTDMPDPLRDTPVTQRKRIDIADQRGLLSAMADNGHEYGLACSAPRATVKRGGRCS